MVQILGGLKRIHFRMKVNREKMFFYSWAAVGCFGRRPTANLTMGEKMIVWLIVACVAMCVAIVAGIFLVINTDLELTGGLIISFAASALIGLIIWVSIVGYQTVAAESRCKVLNEAFDKHYTPEQVLFAGDIIQKTIEGNYNRIQLNVENK